MWRFAASVTLSLLPACGQAPPADGRLHLRGPGVRRSAPDPAFAEEGRYVLAGERRAWGCHYRGASVALPSAARGSRTFAERTLEEDWLRCRLLIGWTTTPAPNPTPPGSGSSTWTTTFAPPSGPAPAAAPARAPDGDP
jgi:hypothetical protein